MKSVGRLRPVFFLAAALSYAISIALVTIFFTYHIGRMATLSEYRLWQEVQANFRGYATDGVIFGTTMFVAPFALEKTRGRILVLTGLSLFFFSGTFAQILWNYDSVIGSFKLNSPFLYLEHDTIVSIVSLLPISHAWLIDQFGEAGLSLGLSLACILGLLRTLGKRWVWSILVCLQFGLSVVLIFTLSMVVLPPFYFNWQLSSSDAGTWLTDGDTMIVVTLLVLVNMVGLVRSRK